MRSLVILFSLFFVLSVFGWRENISDCSQVMVGRDTLGNKVYANYMKLSDEVEKGENPEERYYIFTLKDLPYVVLSHNKEIAVYNYVTGELVTKILSPKKIRFRKATNDGILVSSDKMRGTVYQFFNYAGEKLWETKSPFSFFDTWNDIVIFFGYSYFFGISNYTIAGNDLKTGNQLWDYKFKTQNPILFCNPMNNPDSTRVYFMADSLNSVDLMSGITRSHPFKSRVIPNRGLSIIWVGEPDTIRDPNLFIENKRSIADPKHMTGLFSNSVVRGDTLFIADAEKLYAFNKDLQPYWTTPLPTQMGSKSTIRLDGDRLLLFNYGIGFYNENVIRQGKPFALSFSIKDGKTLHSTIPEADDYMISGMYTDSGKLYWLTRKNLYYSDEGEKELHTIDWKSMKKIPKYEKHLRYAIIDTLWRVRNNKIEPIVSDNQQVVIKDWVENIVHVLKHNGEEEIISGNDVYSFDSNDSERIYLLPKNQERDILKTRKMWSNSHHLRVDSVTKEVSHYLFTPRIYGEKGAHLVIKLEGGLGFLDLTNQPINE